MNVLDYNEFILESNRVEEGIIDKWNDKKFLNEIKAYLTRYYNKVFLKNLSKDNKQKLEKLNDLYTKYTGGAKDLKDDLFRAAKELLDKKKSVTNYSADSIIKPNYN